MRDFRKILAFFRATPDARRFTASRFNALTISKLSV
jgi:hypothetical protein